MRQKPASQASTANFAFDRNSSEKSLGQGISVKMPASAFAERFLLSGTRPRSEISSRPLGASTCQKTARSPANPPDGSDAPAFDGMHTSALPQQHRPARRCIDMQHAALCGCKTHRLSRAQRPAATAWAWNSKADKLPKRAPRTPPEHFGRRPVRISRTARTTIPRRFCFLGPVPRAQTVWGDQWDLIQLSPSHLGVQTGCRRIWCDALRHSNFFTRIKLCLSFFFFTFSGWTELFSFLATNFLFSDFFQNRCVMDDDRLPSLVGSGKRGGKQHTQRRPLPSTPSLSAVSSPHYRTRFLMFQPHVGSYLVTWFGHFSGTLHFGKGNKKQAGFRDWNLHHCHHNVSIIGIIWRFLYTCRYCKLDTPQIP